MIILLLVPLIVALGGSIYQAAARIGFYRNRTLHGGPGVSGGSGGEGGEGGEGTVGLWLEGDEVGGSVTE